MIVSMPAARAICTCQAVARVSAVAPFRNIRAHMVGDIVVFPCGASSSPRSDVQRCIAARLRSTTALSTVSTGVVNSASHGGDARTSRTVRPQ